jgi:hypothetical protein
MKKTTKPSIPSPDAPTLDQLQIIRAAVNLPVDTFTLGDRVFPLKDLSYDSYIAFIGYLTPLIEHVVEKIAGGQGISIPGIDLKTSLFSANNILSLCKEDLPEMVQLMCRESDPDITVAQVKELAKRPTVLVTAIILQVKQNEMIKDFADFFGQVLSVLKPLTPALNPST